MLPLGSIIRKYGLGYHCYADDMQLYVSTMNIQQQPRSSPAACQDIKAWMQLSFLQLNCGKTEVILLSTKTLKQLAKIDGVQVIPSTQVRNLGVYLDSQLSFEAHIKHVTRVSFFHWRNIARIHRCLSQPAAERLIHAFIASRLDYCNALLAGETDKTINQLLGSLPTPLPVSTSPLCTGSPSAKALTTRSLYLLTKPSTPPVHPTSQN